MNRNHAVGAAILAAMWGGLAVASPATSTERIRPVEKPAAVDPTPTRTPQGPPSRQQRRAEARRARKEARGE